MVRNDVDVTALLPPPPPPPALAFTACLAGLTKPHSPSASIDARALALADLAVERLMDEARFPRMKP